MKTGGSRRMEAGHPFLKKVSGPAFFQAVRQIAADEGEESYAAVFLRLSWKRQFLNYMASARLSCLCSLTAALRQIEPGEKILVFCERICQAEEACRQLRRSYPAAELYHSGIAKDARKQILERFRNGSSRILVTCRALDEGVDVPDASVGIILSGTSASRQHIQRLGRILRRSSGKAAACMYYLYIKESSEDSAFLADTGEHFPVCSLTYSQTEQIFIHPAYEEAAARLLKQIEEKQQRQEQTEEKQQRQEQTEEKRQRQEQTVQAAEWKPMEAAAGNPAMTAEVRRCLELGLVRSDWLLPERELEKKIREAEGQKERNYWLCMKWMGKECRI